MIKKICENCGKEFNAQRYVAKFCSSSCRALFWQKQKSLADAEMSFKNNLKGVLKDDERADTKNHTIKQPEMQTILNPEYLIITKQIADKEKEINNLKTEHDKLMHNLDKLKNSDLDSTALRTATLGATLGFVSPFSKEDLSIGNRIGKAFIYSIIGLTGGTLIDNISAESRKKDRIKAIAQVNVKIKDVNANITLKTQELNSLQDNRIKVNREITVEKNSITKRYLNLDFDTEKTIKKQEIQSTVNVKSGQLTPGLTLTNASGLNIAKELTLTNVKKPVSEPLQTLKNANQSDKIISSSQLTKIDYMALNFKSKWQNFFGNPSINFHCVVHGMPGEGKSTFAIQFANYLAENIGTVIYVSGEEGFSKTMKDKIVRNNAVSENLFLADLRKYQDLIKEVKPNTYNFIFIDSLDNMGIGANELKEIRNLYINSALITISQSTKDGKIRGSNEIVHDSYIAVAVSDGVATTTKNRFLEKGRFYQIFDKPSDNENKLMPWGMVRG